MTKAVRGPFIAPAAVAPLDSFHWVAALAEEKTPDKRRISDETGQF